LQKATKIKDAGSPAIMGIYLPTSSFRIKSTTTAEILSDPKYHNCRYHPTIKFNNMINKLNIFTLAAKGKLFFSSFSGQLFPNA